VHQQEKNKYCWIDDIDRKMPCVRASFLAVKYIMTVAARLSFAAPILLEDILLAFSLWTRLCRQLPWLAWHVASWECRPWFEVVA
jgi:hypothetical protein